MNGIPIGVIMFAVSLLVSIFSIGYAFGRSAGNKEAKKEYYDNDFLDEAQ